MSASFSAVNNVTKVYAIVKGNNLTESGLSNKVIYRKTNVMMALQPWQVLVYEADASFRSCELAPVAGWEEGRTCLYCSFCFILP